MQNVSENFFLIFFGKRVIAHIKSRFHTHDIKSGKKHTLIL